MLNSLSKEQMIEILESIEARPEMYGSIRDVESQYCLIFFCVS